MRAPVPKRRGFANGGQPTDVVTHLNPESRVGAVITMPWSLMTSFRVLPEAGWHVGAPAIVSQCTGALAAAP